MKKWILPVLPIVVYTMGATAQVAPTDSLPQSRAVQTAVNLYTRAVREQARIYNGSEYQEFTRPAEGHPFFESDTWEEGTVWYDGEDYRNIAVMYDILHDELVIEHYDQKGYMVKIKVLQSRINRFSLLGHTFVRIQQDAAGNFREGFYDLLYDGGSRVMVKRKKTFTEEVDNTNTVKIIFSTHNQYFIEHGGRYYQVKGRASIMRVLKDKKRPLSQYIRKEQLNFKERREHDLVKLAAFYDQI